jgi:ABC-2 type transport system permease protein
MRNIWTIASREYKLYFASPVAYLIAFMILVVIGVFFTLTLSAATVQQFTPGIDTVLGPLPTLLLLAIPAVTTRLLAEESRLGTIELLLTAPVRDWELVIGKWLGAFLFVLTIIAVTLVYPLVLNQLVSPGIDQGPVLTGYLGLVLLSAALVAVGVLISSLFSNQIAAFATTMGVLIVLWWVLGPIAQVAGPAGQSANLFQYLDFSSHYFDSLFRGIIEVKDIVYYLSVTALGLFLGTMVVETRRWR